MIDEKSLINRINLNYNNHQTISAESIKDIINTEKKIDNTLVLEDIENEIICSTHHYFDGEPLINVSTVISIIEKHIDDKDKRWLKSLKTLPLN